jgi:hypothetical protein
MPCTYAADRQTCGFGGGLDDECIPYPWVDRDRPGPCPDMDRPDAGGSARVAQEHHGEQQRQQQTEAKPAQ